MVSFECSSCSETIKKPKIKRHLDVCKANKLTCVDCNENFDSKTVHAHIQCITEAEKERRIQPKKPNYQKSSKTEPCINFSMKIQPWHITEAYNTLLDAHPNKKPKLKMLARHSLHVAFLSELRNISKQSEPIVHKIAKENNIGIRGE